MPIFDLSCIECDYTEETWCKYEDLKEQVCKVCGSLMVREYTTNEGGALGATIRGVGVYKTGTY